MTTTIRFYLSSDKDDDKAKPLYITYHPQGQFVPVPHMGNTVYLEYNRDDTRTPFKEYRVNETVYEFSAVGNSETVTVTVYVTEMQS